MLTLAMTRLGLFCYADAMMTRMFHLSSYIPAEEHFHFARKELETRPPEFQHNHSYYEIFLIEAGSAVHLINGRSETLTRGMLVFIRPMDAHSFRASGEHGCRLINVMFRSQTADHLRERYGPEIGDRFFWKAGADPDSYLLAGPRLERAINSFGELRAARRSLARIEQFLLYFMTRVVDYDALLPPDTPHWLIQACQATRAPVVFRKGALGFVEVAGRGHAHVCRAARKHLGLSPSAYVNRVRMEYAAMLLGSTNKPIDEISQDCGIENLSHFYRLFRLSYGNTPRDYRKLHRADPVQPQT